VARLQDRRSEFAELTSKSDSLQGQISEIKVRLDEARQFAAATDDDLIELENCALGAEGINLDQAVAASALQAIEQRRRALKSAGG